MFIYWYLFPTSSLVSCISIRSAAQERAARSVLNLYSVVRARIFYRHMITLQLAVSMPCKAKHASHTHLRFFAEACHTVMNSSDTPFTFLPLHSWGCSLLVHVIGWSGVEIKPFRVETMHEFKQSARHIPSNVSLRQGWPALI